MNKLLDNLPNTFIDIFVLIYCSLFVLCILVIPVIIFIICEFFILFNKREIDKILDIRNIIISFSRDIAIILGFNILSLILLVLFYIDHRHDKIKKQNKTKQKYDQRTTDSLF
jgi:hypothetical protein